MKQIELDHEDDRIKRFIRKLSTESGGVELRLGGEVVCKVIGPNELSEADRDAILATGWDAVQKAQQRNTDVPAKVIEREVRDAVTEVRRRRQNK